MRVVLVSVLFLVIAACAPTTGEDLDTFCKVVNEINRDNSLPADRKLAQIFGRKQEFSKASPEPWTRVETTATQEKYAVVVDAAKKGGKDNWKCTSFEKLLVVLSVQEAKEKAAQQEKVAEVAPATPPPATAVEKNDDAPRKKKASKRDKAKRNKSRNKKKRHG